MLGQDAAKRAKCIARCHCHHWAPVSALLLALLVPWTGTQVAQRLPNTIAQELPPESARQHGLQAWLPRVLRPCLGHLADDGNQSLSPSAAARHSACGYFLSSICRVFPSSPIAHTRTPSPSVVATDSRSFTICSAATGFATLSSCCKHVTTLVLPPKMSLHGWGCVGCTGCGPHRFP